MSKSSETIVICLNRFCWLLAVAALCLAIHQALAGNWWMTVYYASSAVVAAAAAIVPPNLVRRKGGE